MSFIVALDAELEALHNVLSTDPTFVKWRELQRVRGLYGQASVDLAVSGTNGTTVFQAKQVPARADADNGVRGRRADPGRTRAVQEAEAIIRDANGDPVPTSDILDKLQDHGIVVPGERPLNNLSAMLSNSGLFTANGRRGWTLKQDGENEPDVESFVEEKIQGIIESFVILFDEDQNKHVSSFYRDYNQIPSDIDGKLLATIKDTLGRELSKAERALMQSNFIKAVHQNDSPA